MVVKGPSRGRIPSLAKGFPDVMQQGGPPQPEIIAACGHVVCHLQRMVEIILVGAPVFSFYHIQGCQFRHYQLQEAAPVQLHQSARGRRAHHDFIQLTGHAFTSHPIDFLALPLQRRKSLVFDLKFEGSGEAYAAKHAQRVLVESRFRVARSGDNAILQVCPAVKRVHYFAKMVGIQANGYCMDGKIPVVEVIVECRCPREINRPLWQGQLCRFCALCCRELRIPQSRGHSLCHLDATTCHHQDMDIP